MNIPAIALIIFRRPEFTARVLEAISRVKPSKLLVVADGPRLDRTDDVEACAATRAIIDRVDWNCEVIKNYSDTNLGCGRRPATGLDWVFQQVEEAIILEDDCVPHPSFFRFCGEMLERYRHDTRVMHIAGCTYHPGSWPSRESYHFSCFNGAWGWATWRRAWQHYDIELKLWRSLQSTSWLMDILSNDRAVRHWTLEFQRAYDRAGAVSYWDHQWTFACWAQSGLSIVPTHNLVSNIGCGPDATHTFDANDPTGNLPTEEMRFPLVHPPTVIRNYDLDRRKLKEVILPRLPRPVPPVRRLVLKLTPNVVKRAYHAIQAAIGTEAFFGNL